MYNFYEKNFYDYSWVDMKRSVVERDDVPYTKEEEQDEDKRIETDTLSLFDGRTPPRTC